jgi:arylsulfatase A-like enzyme
VWFISDDARPVGAYGDTPAHTPNIDQFANSGILSRSAFSNAPVCAPTRSSHLAGILPESCGPARHMRSYATLPDINRIVPEYLRAAQTTERPITTRAMSIMASVSLT